MSREKVVKLSCDEFDAYMGFVDNALKVLEAKKQTKNKKTRVKTKKRLKMKEA